MAIPECLKILRRLVKLAEKIDIKHEPLYIKKKHISEEKNDSESRATIVFTVLSGNVTYKNFSQIDYRLLRVAYWSVSTDRVKL